jgi:hypothetical protein
MEKGPPMYKHRVTTRPEFIRPGAEAVGPLSPLRELLDHYGIDQVVRAIDAGLDVYDGGTLLLASGSAFRLIRDMNTVTVSGAAL